MRQTCAWQSELARAVTDAGELLRLVELHDHRELALRAAAQPFGLRVPHGFIRRMCKGDPYDPLLRQVLPLAAEDNDTAPGFGIDPVGDLAALMTPGVLHKYSGRVLLVTTGACAVHCRYCFRRHFPYAEANPAADHWDNAVDYIAADTGIHEVILSGGDPLMLSDARLAALANRLQALGHVRTLRLHTRLPVVLPERVDDTLLAWLTAMRLRTVMVIHANHANELDAGVSAAMARLKSGGVTLLNQSVLLRGVNDDWRALRDLSEALFDMGVLPYYLHMLDKVQGAAHFEVDDTHAAYLMRKLHAHVPGYLLPRLVLERPGSDGKCPVRW